MVIYVASDESGTFSRNETFFAFGGIILLGKEERELACQRYAFLENLFRQTHPGSKEKEIKASGVTPKWKAKFYKNLSPFWKFAAIIRIDEVNPVIHHNKRSKQRYLDFAYKIALRYALEELIAQRVIKPSEIERIAVEADEHSTATNGLYELREGLLAELKIGTFNATYEKFFPPLFSRLETVDVSFCDSKGKATVRMADFIANHVYNGVRFGTLFTEPGSRLFLRLLPPTWGDSSYRHRREETVLVERSLPLPLNVKN